MTMQQQGQERNAADLHIPVLMKETLAALQPVLDAGRDRPVRILDGTLGMAGHSSAMLQAAPQAELCALDRDEEALELARRRLEPFGGRVHTYHCRYSQFEEALDDLGWDKVDAVLLDIGVSSLQLDEAERGFSFYGDGPLDMRMDQHSGAPSAWHWDARQKSPIDTTAQLAALVEKAYPPAWRAKARRHPATRTFQALRMAVNDELGELRRFLDAILGRLSLGGRLAVISFHSLEDRMVKQTMRYWAEGCRCPRHVPVCVCHHVPEVEILYKKPVQADDDELAVNPRASSAKLRAVEKIAEAVS